MAHISLHTPIADLTVFEHNSALVAVEWGWTEQIDLDKEQSDGSVTRGQIDLLREAKKQLDAYFDGDLRVFDLPLYPYGTDHQVKVWRAMQQIPYGEVRTYGDIARDISSSAQAVGNACGRNPLPIIIPCHRIVAAGATGSDQWLGGYSGDGGPWTKRALLTLEEVLPPDYS